LLQGWIETRRAAKGGLRQEFQGVWPMPEGLEHFAIILNHLPFFVIPGVDPVMT
jgi:hypothetical protein